MMTLGVLSTSAAESSACTGMEGGSGVSLRADMAVLDELLSDVEQLLRASAEREPGVRERLSPGRLLRTCEALRSRSRGLVRSVEPLDVAVVAVVLSDARALCALTRELCERS